MTAKQTALIAELVANAPKWAAWLAIDKDGAATYFSDKPRLVKDGGFWATKRMESQFENDCEERKGFEKIWENTLTKINARKAKSTNE